MLSPALGGVIIGHEVAAALGVPFRFTERKGEEMGLRRGFALRQGERVVVVEDVVTTGRSTLRDRGARHRPRRAGGRRSARSSTAAAAATASTCPSARCCTLDLPTYPPDECPLCRAGGRRPRSPAAGRARVAAAAPPGTQSRACDGTSRSTTTETEGAQLTCRPVGAWPAADRGRVGRQEARLAPHGRSTTWTFDWPVEVEAGTAAELGRLEALRRAMDQVYRERLG